MIVKLPEGKRAIVQGVASGDAGVSTVKLVAPVPAGNNADGPSALPASKSAEVAPATPAGKKAEVLEAK
jgi:hypothetical protein